MKNFIFTLLLFILSVSVVNAQTSEPYKWQNIAMGGGGFVSGIITSKTKQSLVYARTDVGGAYRWDIAGNKWLPLLDWTSPNETSYQGVESIAIDPQAPNKLYLLAGTSYFNNGKTAILRSEDYGKTFQITDVSTQFKAHGNGMGRQSGEKLQVDPQNSNVLYCGTRWNGLFKSNDAGVTWEKLNDFPVTTTPNENGISFVVLDAANKNATGTQTIFAGISAKGTNLYKSIDAGQTFSPVAGAPADLLPQRAVMASDGNLVITYANGGGPHGHWSLPEPMDTGQIWKFDTQSGAWTNITPVGFSRAFGGISIDPDNPQRIIASTINTYLLQDNNAYGDQVFLSNNGGSSWTNVFAKMNIDPNGISWINGQSIHWAGSVEFDPFDTQKVWITSGNGIYKTDNINAPTTVWKFMVNGLEETVPLDLISIPNGPVISVIGDYDGFRHTDVTQYAPQLSPTMGTTTGVAYAAKNPNIMLRVGDKMFNSTNMGTTWIQNSINGKKGSVAISANGEVFLHCPEGSSITYRSTDKGSSWAPVSGLNVQDARPVADYVNSNKFYIYNRTNGSVLVSTNGGVSFSAAGSTGGNGSKIIRTTPDIEGHIWVALASGGLTRSTNSGQTFTRINKVSSCEAVGLGKAAPGSNYPAIYIWGTVDNVLGVHRSTDEGATWLRVNDDAHEYGGPGNGQFIVGDMNVFSRVYMSTVGRGIVYGQAEDAKVTGIKDAVEFPFIYAPNPFNSTLQIQAAKPFAYKIYNLVGVVVESGISKSNSAVGANLKPGFYLLSVRNGKQARTVKIVKR